MSYLNFLLVLITFGLIISSGIHIFSRGFLLTRSARVEKATCDSYFINSAECLSNDKMICADEPAASVLRKASKTANICFDRKSKVVILLVDALKYEFGVYDRNLINPLPYQNKLPIISELLQQQPERSRFLKFISDPPTTTLQRLKGMTTGSLPTFIDMGSNFATPEINEDNIIDQIVSSNLTAIFLGDSTWIELFPKRFKRKYSYPSFNIHDLDTIDNAIQKHLPEELKKSDWDVIIAHFLGVDHCGHKYGPVHSEMSRKLTELNDIIKYYANEIDDETMLLVIGDHGMTKTGDHGGSSEDEVEAMLFAYSKEKKFVPTEYDDNIDFIQQIDLAPTLATILGIPIPFSNLGTVSLQLLPNVSYNNLRLFETLAIHLWHNAKQIHKYFTLYSKEYEGTFASEYFDDYESQLAIFKENLKLLSSDEAFKEHARELKTSMDKVLELCRNIWIEFNPRLMSQGMLIAFLGIFAAFIMINNIPLEEFAQIFNRKVMLFQVISSIVVGTFGYLLHSQFGWSEGHIGLLFMTSVWNAVIFGYIIIQNWATIAEEMHKIERISNLVPRISYAFSIAVFFSNSFVIHEQKILCYLLSIQIIYFIYEIRSTTKIADFKGAKMRIVTFLKSTLAKVLLVTLINIFLLRLSYNYFKCREEQGDCWDFLLDGEIEKETQKKMNLLPVVLLAIIVTLIRIYLKTNGNLTGFAPHVLIFKFGSTLSVIAACGHLILAQKQDHRPIVSNINLDMLAWKVYGVFLIEICVVVIKPLLIYVVPRNNEHLNVSNFNNMIPELYRHIRNVFNEGYKSGSVQIPVIYGLATVYSSIFIAFGTIFAVVLSLLLGVDVTNGFLIIFSVAFGSLFVSAILRYESATAIKDCLQPKFSLTITWYLLYCYGFYCTSHQPTISQIDWNVAFVGRASNFDNNNILSAILVLLSTFNATFLLLILYPLMVLFPFMIYSIFPTLAMSDGSKKNREESSMEYRRVTLNDPDEATSTNHFDITRGEINLYENEKLFLSSAFKIGSQLIILQGTKALASMIACTILCRHLMVWKIFAPRFIYEGIHSYISFIVIICGFMLLLRVHAAVKSLINRVNKKY